VDDLQNILVFAVWIFMAVLTVFIYRKGERLNSSVIMAGAVLIGLSILLPMLGVNLANMKGWVSVVGHLLVLVGFFLYLRPRIQKEADAA
jgi:CHASE2 domain-containing sensor protein